MRKTVQKRASALLLALALALALAVPAAAEASGQTVSAAVTDMAGYVLKTVKSPQVGSTGGEWAVLGLARSGYAVPEKYFQDYYAAVEDYVRACGGVLHERKYTEYSRVIVALSAIGRDARDVAGYDLTKALGDYDKTVWQGTNGPVWALIALDSRDYPMPVNSGAKTQATRQMYVDRILELQLSDGGWSLTGTGSSEADITGMALQALAKYQDQAKVQQAIDAGLGCLSAKQDENGGFSSWGTDNSESCVQAVVALCELGISVDDGRFVKNGKTVLDALMGFYTAGKGFSHTGDVSNQMASEQGLYALVAVQRAQQGKNSLYRMGDAVAVSGGAAAAPGAGLSGRHRDVKAVPVSAPGMTFDDISGAKAHANRAAIEALASRGIISGMGNGKFCPDETMTRAQFAAIVVRALGLTPEANSKFSDVPAGEWYAAYVGAASDYGIINGVGEGRFNPGGTITKQEAAVMAARAAKLCGMDTELDTASVRDVLAQFGDYVRTPEWARQGLAFCYAQDILDDSGTVIDGTAVVRRCEIAQMLFNLLSGARLL